MSENSFYLVMFIQLYEKKIVATIFVLLLFQWNFAADPELTNGCLENWNEDPMFVLISKTKKKSFSVELTHNKTFIWSVTFFILE
jgi:hypothetical protein